MPRRLKGKTGGIVFHVMNRRVQKMPLFLNDGDYAAFFTVMCEAAARVAMRVIAVALMPNHWHMVLWPRADGDLTQYVGWLSHTHVVRWQRAHDARGLGPVYQSRFKAIPVESDAHFYRVVRYVERNPPRANLVVRAGDWPWSSASTIAVRDRPELHPWPLERPSGWTDVLNESESDFALSELRECVKHSRPFGTESWRDDVARRLNWVQGMRRVGRPCRAQVGR